MAQIGPEAFDKETKSPFLFASPLIELWQTGLESINNSEDIR
jgi:hypothetical protein